MRPRYAPALLLLVAVLGLAACTDQSESPPVTASPTPTPTQTTTTATAEPPQSFTGAWTDVTATAIGTTADWTNKVELADINSDGFVDRLFANGGGYDTPSTPVLSQIFLNHGDGTFEDASASVLGGQMMITRVIKVGDLNADGIPDIVLGTTFGTQSHLLLGTGGGAFTDVTSTNLPAADLSAGDLELGDVDADGDLDIAIVDWGDDEPTVALGGVRLWINDGAGVFTDATSGHIPERFVGFSWDLEMIDVDNDWDLDLAVSCKICGTSLLFRNDGSGTFTDVTSDHLPAFGNNYEFAPIDLDGDGFLDLVTINDGPQVEHGLTEHVFRNDGTGAYVDMTDAWWPKAANPGWDDNAVAGLDVDSDGDADFLIGSLDGPDRLLINDGSGGLTLADDVFDTPKPSGGTLGFAVADLNGDGRLDVVDAGGEVSGSKDERIYFATDVVPVDTAAPVVRWEAVGSSVLARVHDNQTPNMPQDWQSVTVRWSGGEAPMIWYGENLFRAGIPAGVTDLEVCAVDAVGNETCVE
jgi:hypothetical protein